MQNCKDRIGKKIGIDIDVKPETVTPVVESPKEEAPSVETAPKKEALATEDVKEEQKPESPSEKK